MGPIARIGTGIEDEIIAIVLEKHAMEEVAIQALEGGQLKSRSFLVVLGALAVAAASPTPPAGSEKDIVALEKEWAECFVTGNPAAAREFIADDFTAVSSKAERYGKAEAIRQIVDSKGKYKSLDVRDVRVRFYGDAAVAQGTDVWEMSDGKRGSAVWTDTWVRTRTRGRWLIVAAQDTTPQ